ncbi:hypothetical protein BpHYR1_027239 [Brachionus plicatilis]|uniref:Uncharacterized protein n=1 Tax=Brachionus plicatilis TaxID=10195 RepID=A0A3M7SNY5_BRAPC|nr:hypothetical protein BpHYR1_027239 [Brachionus plicatilis]
MIYLYRKYLYKFSNLFKKLKCSGKSPNFTGQSGENPVNRVNIPVKIRFAKNESYFGNRLNKRKTIHYLINCLQLH